MSASFSPSVASPPGGGALASPERLAGVEAVVRKGAAALAALQKPDGAWAFELEADATIPAEYILLDHFLGTVTPAQQALHERMAVYLREIQEAHGGWPLFHRGALNLSASVKAYFALKAVGDLPDAPHMRRARDAIRAAGGAEKANVFTRIQLALFGLVPWRAVPVMPVEIMFLPRWFPFHLNKVAYWSRTVIVPLLVLMALKPKAANPRGVRLDELFVTPPGKVRNWHSSFEASPWVPFFRAVDSFLRVIEPLIPVALRGKAIAAAVAWVKERLNGEDGLGAIYPAMANAVMMYHALGRPAMDPDRAIARASIDKMVVDGPARAYCQPCLSPVWDTALACHALMEADAAPESVRRGCDWLRDRQVLDVAGDWAVWRPGLRPGGWAFQYANPHYPDLDDTAAVALALDRCDSARYRQAIDRATEWVLGMQSTNGGWGAFDADNDYAYLNHIPFADHGALLDPPSADVTARCVSMLAHFGHGKDSPPLRAALAYLRREQEPEGCWFGRWGTNYIYGTWSVLCALNAAKLDSADPMVRRAVAWLVAKQRSDGGWGEDGASYDKGHPKGEGPVSTASQTAWALLGLMAAGEVAHEAVARGVAFLIATQKETGPDAGVWEETPFTAVGFPRVFYLRYHGYRAFFPVWALARYRQLCSGNAAQVLQGL